MTREICRMCMKPNPVGFKVPDSIWNASVPLSYIDKVLCLSCFALFADENKIQWDIDIEFFPISLVTLHTEVI